MFLFLRNSAGANIRGSRVLIHEKKQEESASTVDEQVHRYNKFDAGDNVQEEISGTVPDENTTEASAFAIDDQVYGEDLTGVAEVDSYFLPGNDVPEDFSGPVPGNTTEASTFAIDEQIYEYDLTGVAEVPAYLLPGNDVPEDFGGQMSGNTQKASTYAIDGQVYGEDLSGVAEVPAYLLPGNYVTEDFAKSGITQEASTFANDEQVYEYDLSGLVDDVPEDFAGPMSGNNQGLGDWVQCTSNSQCSNGCCSDAAVAGVFSCIPLSGDFDPSICTAV